MHDQWADVVTDLESGEPDRVNDVLDEIDAMSPDDRLALPEACVDDLPQRYDAADDGYVRQSSVRVAEHLVPGIPTVLALDRDDRSIDADEAMVRERTDALCGFLLTAITDEDGRVGQSATRGLRAVFRTDDAHGDEETPAALVAELDELGAGTEENQSARQTTARCSRSSQGSQAFLRASKTNSGVWELSE